MGRVENTVEVNIIQPGVSESYGPKLAEGEKIQFCKEQKCYRVKGSQVCFYTSWNQSGFTYDLFPGDFEYVLPRRGSGMMPGQSHLVGHDPSYIEEFFGRPDPYLSAKFLGDWRRSDWLALMDKQEATFDANSKLGVDDEEGIVTLFAGPVFRSSFYGTGSYEYYPPSPKDSYKARAMAMIQTYYYTKFPDTINRVLMKVATEADLDSLVRVEESEIFGIYGDKDKLDGFARGLAVANTYLTKVATSTGEYPWLRKGFTLEQLGAWWNFLYHSYNYSFEYAEEHGFGDGFKKRYGMEYRKVKNTLKGRDINIELSRIKEVLKLKDGA